MNRSIVVMIVIFLVLFSVKTTLEGFSALQSSPATSWPMYDGLYNPEFLMMDCESDLLQPDGYVIQARLKESPACKWKLANTYMGNPGPPIMSI